MPSSIPPSVSRAFSLGTVTLWSFQLSSTRQGPVFSLLCHAAILNPLLGSLALARHLLWLLGWGCECHVGKELSFCPNNYQSCLSCWAPGVSSLEILPSLNPATQQHFLFP